MTRTLQAVYENGAFRPLEPVSCREQERVLLTVESMVPAEDNLLDQEFLGYCETQADDSVSLEAVPLPPLPAAVEVAAYRIVLEALTMTILGGLLGTGVGLALMTIVAALPLKDQAFEFLGRPTFSPAVNCCSRPNSE